MQQRFALRVGTILRILSAVGLLWQAGCKKTESSKESRPSLLQPGEVDKIRTTIAAIAAGNANQKCLRPVLRSEAALEGKADADMLALLAEEGAMKDCYSALESVEVTLVEGADMLAWLGSSENPAKQAGQSGENTAAIASIAKIEASCSMLAAALSKAVSHEDACSPYLPGRLGQGPLKPLMWLTKASVLGARGLAARGKALQAVQLLLDTLRFGQDLSRGGTSLIEPMMGYAAHRLIRPDLDLRLNELLLDELRVVEEELGLLIESQPHYSEYFDGERDNIAMFMVWPYLEPDGWQPPGGYPKGQSGPIDLVMGHGPTEQESAVFLWDVARDNAKLQHELCAKPGPLQDCIAATEAHAATRSDRTKLDIAKLLKMATLSEAAGRAEVRKQITDVLQVVGLPSYSRYQLRMEAVRLGLVAQQNKVRSLIAAQNGEPCPSAFASDDKAATPRVEMKQGEVQLYLPQWMVDQAKSGAEQERMRELLVRFRCPSS